MEDVEVALRKLVTKIGQTINAADEAVNVIMPLRYLASLLRGSDHLGAKLIGGTKSSSRTSLTALDEITSLCRDKASHAFPKCPAEIVLSRAFYGGPCFAVLAQLLLHKVAVGWLACFTLLEQTTLFDDFFTNAPLDEAICVLVEGMSVEQVSEDDEANNVTAACGQAERLLVLILITRQGVKKLPLSFSSPTEVFQVAGLNPRGLLARYQQKNSQLAQLLSSMPDRASLQAPTALRSPFYVQSVVSQLLVLGDENWVYCSTNDSCSQVSSSDETFKFIGEVVSRLCRRGHADVIASQMVPILLQHLSTATRGHGVELAECQQSHSSLEEVIEKLQMSMWPVLAASITDSHALERFSEALIKEIATKADITDWQAYCCLHTLYGKLLKERATTRSLFTEKFLFGNVLPIRCLKWVLHFAILCCPPPSEHWLQPEKHESKIKTDVVRRLAEVWATKDFIQSASVQHQAYLTAALGICLGSMTKTGLEGTNGLVPSLLKGISNRLDSPLNPVRQMAKRIALAFSTLVDPGNPLLFDEDDSIEDLLNWEGLGQWFTLNLRISKSEVWRKQIAVKEVGKDLDGESQGVNDGDGKNQRHERHKWRKAKEEKLALEEDDPDAVVRLGEVGQDDESEQSSESDGESDSALKPYDMSDDEADVCRGKFVTQLADLAINLRKGDKPDAVEEALQRAEKFILAMPEELDSLAADLTHALVHVKCSGVAVEGEEDIAEERRHGALVALLSCSPFQTVSVLTAQLFSPHVDASQRILILDVMAAGARVLSSGPQGNKSSDEERRRRLVTNVPGTTDHNSWYAPGDGGGTTGAGPWVEVSSAMPGGTLVSWAHRYERELPWRPGQRPLGQSRRWGQRAMQLHKDESIRTSNESFKNRFAPLAAAFMLPVMRDYDKKSQGLELLGRDFLVLGGVLSMLGVCMECISMQQEAAILGAGLLEMLRSREISSHSETFVRRTALFAASRVLGALHPSHVLASFTTGMSSIITDLEWVREWALEIATNDMDTDCSVMAMACVHLHSEMALQVQRSMGSLQPSGQTLEAKIYSGPSIIMPF